MATQGTQQPALPAAEQPQATGTANPETEGITVAPAAPQAPPVPHWTQPEYEAEFDDDGDSALGDDNNSSTASISASILEYRSLHGRTYHAEHGNAEYWGPNDDRQNESMDISHQVFTMLIDDKLHLAPLPAKLEKVLDVGTGTGLWAIDFADAHSETQVIGTDISPIQSPWVPPNLKFEIDDATLEWTYAADTFDFVHLRALIGSIPDWNALFREAYKVVKPGGWIESYEISCNISSDDGSIVPGMALYDWGPIMQEAGKKTGRSTRVIEDRLVVKGIEAAGFVDIVTKEVKQPITGYSPDERIRQIGMYNHVAVEQGLEGYGLFLLTQVMGWSPEQVQLYLARVRKELRKKKVHPYFLCEVVYARKPEST